MDATTRRARDVFNGRGQAFYNQAVTFFSDLVVFGTAAMLVEETPDRNGVHFQTVPLHGTWIAEDDLGQVDTVFRKFRFSARQASQRWGENAAEAHKRAVDQRKPDDMMEFLHVVMPREDWMPGKLGTRGMAFASLWLCCESQEVVSEGGYHEFPYCVARWSRDTGELYGSSPGMLALPDASLLQQIARTTLVAAQKASDPPILASDEDAIGTVRMQPGGITFGALDPQGRPLIQPFQSGAAFQLDFAMAEQARQAVRQAFLANLMLLSSQPNETATAVVARREEQMRMMAPHLGRITSEFLDPLLSRVIALMVRAGATPPIPQAMADNPMVKVEYVSPLARQQKAGEAATIIRTMQNVLPLAQARPEVLDQFRWGEVARALAEAEGVPASILATPEEVAQRQQQAAQQAQMAQMAQMAGPAMGAVRDGAEAARALEMARQAGQPMGAA
jgi:hypothetical protein